MKPTNGEVASCARRNRFGPDIPPKAAKIDFYNISLSIHGIKNVPDIFLEFIEVTVYITFVWICRYIENVGLNLIKDTSLLLDIIIIISGTTARTGPWPPLTGFLDG
jgi:hypothetical protein